MEYIISAITDIGIAKKVNQDGLSVRRMSTPLGDMVFAVLCDGMGGLSNGEVASATVVDAFNCWAEEQLPLLCTAPLQDNVIREQWETVVHAQNSMIDQHCRDIGYEYEMGTTVVAILVTQTRYYVLNVGDSRAYEITDSTISQITFDHSYVAREIAMGRMTPEQAKTDPHRNALLQCVGDSENLMPDVFFGDTKQNGVYMLCSDGFRHVVTPTEIRELLSPNRMTNRTIMDRTARSMVELNKQRRERDNISVVLIKTQ